MPPPSDKFDRRECSRKFATWLTSLPELEQWEERSQMAHDLQRIAERLEREDRTPLFYQNLPSLFKISPETTRALASWTETVIGILQIDPPEWSEEKTPLERVQELIDLLHAAAMPLEPLDEWR